MSTRSKINLIKKDGTVRSIYCHNGGYLEGVGAILLDYYTDEKTIDQLMDLGNISIIGYKPVSDKNLWDQGAIYKYDGSTCRTYRDRGETNVDAKSFSSFDELKSKYANLVEEYNYFFINGEWYYYMDDYSAFSVKRFEDELELVPEYN